MKNLSLLAMLVMVFVSLLNPIACGDEAGEHPWSVGYAEALHRRRGKSRCPVLAASDTPGVLWRHY